MVGFGAKLTSILGRNHKLVFVLVIVLWTTLVQWAVTRVAASGAQAEHTNLALQEFRATATNFGARLSAAWGDKERVQNLISDTESKPGVVELIIVNQYSAVLHPVSRLYEMLGDQNFEHVKARDDNDLAHYHAEFPDGRFAYYVRVDVSGAEELVGAARLMFRIPPFSPDLVNQNSVFFVLLVVSAALAGIGLYKYLMQPWEKLDQWLLNDMKDKGLEAELTENNNALLAQIVNSIRIIERSRGRGS